MFDLKAVVSPEEAKGAGNEPAELCYHSSFPSFLSE